VGVCCFCGSDIQPGDADQQQLSFPTADGVVHIAAYHEGCLEQRLADEVGLSSALQPRSRTEPLNEAA
jgi:hypothetical protein